MSEISIRHATRSDAQALNDLYNPLIENNHVSFSYEPFTLESRLQWFDDRPDELPALVAVDGDEIVGMAVASRYRPKEAYNSSPETTIVLADSHHGRGLGTRLLGSLCDELAKRGFHRAMALIALPNDGSIALHAKLGYREVGIMSEVGYKMDRYWDCLLMEKALS